MCSRRASKNVHYNQPAFCKFAMEQTKKEKNMLSEEEKRQVTCPSLFKFKNSI